MPTPKKYILTRKPKEYLKQGVGHFVSIWGYDDTEGVFYIYDSTVPKEYYSKNIPIENIKRPYKDFLRDWNGSIYCKFFGPYPYYQIEEN